MQYVQQNNSDVNNKLLSYLVLYYLIVQIDYVNSNDLVIKKKMNLIENDESPAIYRDESQE